MRPTRTATVTTPLTGPDAPPRAGVLLLDKPLGMSSHSAVARARRALGSRKAGHAGTLDPDAGGLMVLGFGAATRLLTFLVGLDKTYEATIRLGAATSTDDAGGDVLSRPGARLPLPVEAELQQFVGAIRQRPSAVSAVKVDGRRAYDRVRAGEQVELPERDVTIHHLQVLGIRTETVDGTPVVDVDIMVRVSSGTYIRAIARDLGERLAVGGHLTALRRTRVGPFDVTDARTLESLDPQTPLLSMGDVAAAVLPVVTVPPEQATAVSHGQRIESPACSTAVSALFAGEATDGDLLAIATPQDGRWRYLMVVPDRGSGTGPLTK